MTDFFSPLAYAATWNLSQIVFSFDNIVKHSLGTHYTTFLRSFMTLDLLCCRTMSTCQAFHGEASKESAYVAKQNGNIVYSTEKWYPY